MTPYRADEETMNKRIHMTYPLISFLCLSLASPVAWTVEVFRSRAPDGSIIFTDEPQPGTQRLEIQPVISIPVPDSETGTKAGTPDKKTDRHIQAQYQSLVVVIPGDDEAIRDNAGNVTISYDSTPPLNIRRGHTLRILLDGKVVQPHLSGMTVHLTKVDRGSHTLSAVIIDDRGEKLIQSPVTRFHLRRFSKLFNRGGK